MKVLLANTLAEAPEIVIVPIVDNEALPAVLQSVGHWVGLEASKLRENFKGEAGETLPLFAERGRVFLLGLGEKPEFADWLKAFRGFSHKNRHKLSSRIGVSFLHGNAPEALEWVLEAAVNGLRLGVYQLGRYKSGVKERHPLADAEASLRVLVDRGDPAALLAAAEKGFIVADAQMEIFDIVNAPSNYKRPEELGEWVREAAPRHGFTATLLRGDAIAQANLHALLAVSQGSAAPPVFAILEYRYSGGPARAAVGLVGKGVTFDTGGLSIKPSTNMHLMKSDMGGAAAVFGVFAAAARLQLPVHLIGVAPMTENCVDAKAFKPSDVISSHSGKTIEIIDTDAEGRLLLADGLSYLASQYQLDAIIDLATLTGSTVRTLGYHAAALFCNNDRLSNQLFQAGMRTGERLWRFPLWDIYKEEIKSDIADVRNFSGRPIAGAIGAAKFLEAFINGHPAWAHLDIAGVAFNDSEFAAQKSATGFGIRLLLNFLEEFTP